jgi:hypothetical protein
MDAGIRPAEGEPGSSEARRETGASEAGTGERGAIDNGAIDNGAIDNGAIDSGATLSDGSEPGADLSSRSPNDGISDAPGGPMVGSASGGEIDSM